MIPSFQLPSKLFRILLPIAIIFSLIPPQPANAVTPGIIVNTLDYDNDSNDFCSLSEAIYAANYDVSNGGCAAGSGNDTIAFAVSGEISVIRSITLTDAGAADITIDGEDKISLSGTIPIFFQVLGGRTLSLENIAVTGTNTAFDMQNASTINLSNVEISNFTTVFDIRDSSTTIVSSTFDGNQTIITANEFFGPTPLITIQDSTFQNSNGSVSNGRFNIEDGVLDITNSTFSNNATTSLIYTNRGTTLNITNSTFNNNTETSNGSVAINNYGNAIINGTTFENNVSTASFINGGAIQNHGSMQIGNSVFENNGGTGMSNGYGGAIRNNHGTLIGTNSFFSGNYMGEYDAPTVALKAGGAIYSYEGTVNISNSTFTENFAEDGAVLYMFGGQLTASNNTLYNNKISHRNHAMNAGYISGTSSPTVYLYNNIIKEEIGLSGLITRYTCTLSPMASLENYATDNRCSFREIEADELALGALTGSGADQHFPLVPGNPAINGGRDANCTTTDIRGVTRPQGSACDAGAYESRGFTLTRTGGDSQSANVNSGFSDPLTIDITSPFGDPVDGGFVTFSAPASAASTSFAPSTNASISSGAVSLPITANGIEGSYTVSAATIGGDTTLSYALTNMEPPTVSSITATGTNPTSAASIAYKVTFSENVSAVGASDFSLATTGTASGDIYSVIGAGSTYTVTVNNVAGTGTIGLNLVDDDSIVDLMTYPLGGAGLNNGDFTGSTYTVDRDAPTVSSITRVNSNPVQAGTSVDFEVTFSESVNSVDATDFILTVTGGISGVSIGTPTGSGDTWTVPVSVGSASGTIRLDVQASATIFDTVGYQVGAFTGGETYTVDADNPQITSITRVGASPTAAATVDFTVLFNETVSGVDTADFELTTTGSLSAVSIDTVSTGTDSYTVTVDTGTGSGELRLDVADTATIQDASGLSLQGLPYTSGEAYVLDREAAHVTSISRYSPTDASTKNTTIAFRVIFAEGVMNVDINDFQLNLSGTTTGTITSVVSISPPDTFIVNINGVSGTGEISLGFAPGHNIEDLLGNPYPPEPIIDTQENYFIDNSGIEVMTDGLFGMPGDEVIVNGNSYIQPFTSLNIRFDEDAYNPAGHTNVDDVTNPNNYLLLQSGTDQIYDTSTCADFAANGNLPLNDDIQIPTSPVTYDNNSGSGPYIATITLNNGTPLPKGAYRLLICGTTSIYDTLGNELNDGLDSIYNFTLTNPETMPETGFAPNQVTNLSAPEAFYAEMDGLSLEIPTLNLLETILGVPADENNWDIRWLGNKIGWLSGTAYPTWEGNTVLTGHSTNSAGNAEPFANLRSLKWGDQILVHANGQTYVYEVRTVLNVDAQDTSWITKHESLDWITLITCKGYDEQSGSYPYRTIVRAVLVETK